MKTKPRLRLALALAVTPLALASTAHATVVWTAGFEVDKSGDVCASTATGAEFTPGAIVVEGTRIDAEVLGEQVYAGKLACKVTVHPDDIFKQSYNQNRVDVKHISTLTGEGKDMFLSGHYYLVADAQTRNEFGMFETMVDSRNWVDIWVEPKTGGGTTIKLGIESNGANLGSVLIWTGDFLPGVWHQIAIHILWSQDATKGTVDFWLDGKQVVTAFKHKTKPNGNDLYFLTGLHRVVMQPYTESIYFDDFIEADALADIKVGTPMPEGGTGGTSGGAGTSGEGGASGSGGSGAGGSIGSAGSAGGAAGTSSNGGMTGSAGSTGAGGLTGAAGSASAGNAGSTAGTTGGGGATSDKGGATGTGGATGAAGSPGADRNTTGAGCSCTVEARHCNGPSVLALLGILFGATRSRRRSPPEIRTRRHRG